MIPKPMWSEVELLPLAPGRYGEPTLAVAGNSIHLAWVQSGVIHHMWRAGSEWSRPARLAGGTTPRLLARADGSLHCMFLNQFTGISEVYHTTWLGASWSLALNVSRTPGHSFTPTAAFAPDGSLHAAWADTTPGYAVLYYGRLADGRWRAEPVLGARGSHPALAVEGSGDIFLAWQDRLLDTETYDIFCAIRKDCAWQMPEIVSDTRDTQSLHATAAASATGRCVLAWQEEDPAGYQIRTSTRVRQAWSEPSTVSTPGIDCRSPQLSLNQRGRALLAWIEGRSLSYISDSAASAAPIASVDLAADTSAIPMDLALSIGPEGNLHALWCSHEESGRQSLRYICQDLSSAYSEYLPLVSA